MLTKGHARDLLTAIRYGLPDSYRRYADAAIARRLLRLTELTGSQEIHAFWPRPDVEIDIRDCLQTLGACAKLFFPVILHHQRQPPADGTPRIMEAEAAGEAELMSSRWGLLEPDSRYARPFAAEAAIIPGFGVGTNGVRIGHGWGFYDELLANAECPIVMPCYEACVLPEVAGKKYDIRPTIIVTESRIRRNSPRMAV